MLVLIFSTEDLEMRIVLASESPFRKRAMDLLGLPYEIRPSYIDEKAIRDDDPALLTRKLAEAKAHKTAEDCPDAIIVSGDAVAQKAPGSSKSRGREGKAPNSCENFWEALSNS